VREEDGKFNTNQPEQQHLVEMGGTWSPTSNFMVTSLLGVESSWHNSEFADFNEDNYPILFTVWYAPSNRLSLTTGYAFLSNWIDQDITIGFQDNPTETTQWNYDGYNQLFNISANYAWTPTTQLVGGFEWDRGSNVFSVPPSPAGANWSALPSFSDVIVETTRINVGIDHEFTPAMNAYFRYVYFDYEDESSDYGSGTANMFLAGLTMLH
jgi:predicted porin